MKKFLMFAAAALAVSLSSCKKEDEKVIPPDYSDRTVIATLASPYDADYDDYYITNTYREYPKTKVSVDQNRTKYSWDENDKITVNGGVYTFQNLKSEGVAVFKTEVPMRDDSVSGVILHAFYPENIQVEGSKGCLPSRYTYDPNRRGDLSTIPMYAYLPFVQEKVFLFRNIFPAYRISVDPSIGAIDSIVLSSSYGSAVCGPFDVSMNKLKTADETEDGRPIYDMEYKSFVEFLGETGYDRVTLDCGGATGIEYYVPGSGVDKIKLYPSNGDTVVLNVVDAGNPWMTYHFAFAEPTVMAEKIVRQMYSDFANDVISEEKYGYSPMFVCQNLCGDDILASDCDGRYPALAELNEFRYGVNNEAVVAYFNGIVNALHAVNYFQANSSNNYGWELVWDPQTATEKYLAAQCKAFRAYLQYLLMIGWNNPPIYSLDNFIDQAVPGNATWEDNLEYIVKELSEAVGSGFLPDVGGTNSLQITKQFAKALLGKVFLWQNKYSEAASSFDEVMGSGCCALCPNYADVFRLGTAASENMFVMAYDGGDGFSHSINWRTSAFAANPVALYSGTLYGYGCLGVRQAFGDEFFKSSGDTRFAPSLRKITDAVCTPDFYDDPDIRSMGYDDLKASDLVGIKNSWRSESLYLPWKFQSRNSDASGERYFTVMRYAEVLLMAAEAHLMAGDAAKASEYLNKVLERAGLQPVSSCTLDDIKKEKAFELAFEGCRWYDILRWGDAYTSSVLKDGWQNIPVLCDTMFRKPQAGDKDIVWENDSKENSRFYTYRTEYEGPAEAGFKDKHKCFPYPEDYRAKVARAGGVIMQPEWEQY